MIAPLMHNIDVFLLIELNSIETTLITQLLVNL